MGAKKDPFFVYINNSHPEVTGSCIQVTVRYPNNEKTNFFVDCGLFQEKSTTGLIGGLTLIRKSLSLGS